MDLKFGSTKKGVVLKLCSYLILRKLKIPLSEVVVFEYLVVINIRVSFKR